MKASLQLQPDVLLQRLPTYYKKPMKDLKLPWSMYIEWNIELVYYIRKYKWIYWLDNPSVYVGYFQIDVSIWIMFYAEACVRHFRRDI